MLTEKEVKIELELCFPINPINKYFVSMDNKLFLELNVLKYHFTTYVICDNQT